MNKGLREKLAELEHIQWQSWMKFMLNNFTEDNIERWKNQLETPYSKLTNEEKESDRGWADRVIEIVNSN